MDFMANRARKNAEEELDDIPAIPFDDDDYDDVVAKTTVDGDDDEEEEDEWVDPSTRALSEDEVDDNDNDEDDEEEVDNDNDDDDDDEEEEEDNDDEMKTNTKTRVDTAVVPDQETLSTHARMRKYAVPIEIVSQLKKHELDLLIPSMPRQSVESSSTSGANRRRVDETIREIISARGFSPGVPRGPGSIVATGGGQKTLVVHWDWERKKMGVDDARTIIGEWSDDVTQVIVVYAGSITSPAKKLLLSAHANIQIFKDAELVRFIVNHSMCPKQERMSVAQVRAVLGPRGDTSKLPYIKRSSDAVCRLNGWDVGDVIRSTRVLGGTMEPQTCYRVVVP